MGGWGYNQLATFVKLKKHKMKSFRPLVILIRLLKESVAFAFQSITSNKLRTFLSLFGITIGIFAIISVFTVIDSLEQNVRNSLQSLGNNVIYVQKWPWGGMGEYPWWKYMNRPQPNVHDLNEITGKSALTLAASLTMSTSRQVKYEKNSMTSSLIGVSTDYDQIRSFDIANGRFFTGFELSSTKNLAIIGSKIADELCEGVDPINKTIKIAGLKYTIIGVFKKEGTSPFGDESHDELIAIPLNSMTQFVNIRWANPFIAVKAKENIPVEELSDELMGILRSFHRIKPMDEEDFALNRISMMQDQLDTIFSSITLAGGIIAFFSILVGGFGIANIMFVSVKERTSQIGIQKALGAKRYFILTQFLFEAVLLSAIGGIIGLLLIYIGTLLVGNSMDFEISLSLGNIIKGLLISITIGIISGFVPAWQASKLSPVEAITKN